MERSGNIMKKINEVEKKIDKIISNDLEHIRQGQEEILQLLRGSTKDSNDIGIIGRISSLENNQKAIIAGLIFVIIFAVERIVDYIMKL